VTPVIQQTAHFRTSPRTLFKMYLDSKKHSQSTGKTARISRKVGGHFRAFDGMLEGKNLLIVPGKQIVQFWRATHWKKEDWSILILTFGKVAGGAQIDLGARGSACLRSQGRAGRLAEVLLAAVEGISVEVIEGLRDPN
jgi:hypothetical protein